MILIVCSYARAEAEVLKQARRQVEQGLKRRDELHVWGVFSQHTRNIWGRFAPIRPCTCAQPLIHGKEFLRCALEMLKISVRDDHEFEEVYREVTISAFSYRCARAEQGPATFALSLSRFRGAALCLGARPSV